MILLYFFSFIPIFFLTFILYFNLRKAGEFGNRPGYLLVSIIILSLNGIILYAIKNTIFEPLFSFSMYTIGSILF